MLSLEEKSHCSGPHVRTGDGLIEDTQTAPGKPTVG